MKFNYFIAKSFYSSKLRLHKTHSEQLDFPSRIQVCADWQPLPCDSAEASPDILISMMFQIISAKKTILTAH